MPSVGRLSRTRPVQCHHLRDGTLGHPTDLSTAPSRSRRMPTLRNAIKEQQRLVSQAGMVEGHSSSVQHRARPHSRSLDYQSCLPLATSWGRPPTPFVPVVGNHQRKVQAIREEDYADLRAQHQPPDPDDANRTHARLMREPRSTADTAVVKFAPQSAHRRAFDNGSGGLRSLT